jgi:hypothetical protein
MSKHIYEVEELSDRLYVWRSDGKDKFAMSVYKKTAERLMKFISLSSFQYGGIGHIRLAFHSGDRRQ